MYTYVDMYVDSILAAPFSLSLLTSPADGKTRGYVLYVRKTTTNNNKQQST